MSTNISSFNIININHYKDLIKKFDDFLLFLSTFLVIMLQVGLLLIRSTPTNKLAPKTGLNLFVCAIVFYYIGDTFAYGQLGNSFIGFTELRSRNNTLSVTADSNMFRSNGLTLLSRVCIASTVPVIILSITAKKASNIASFVTSLVVVGFVYPVVVHWCWSDTGWLKTGAGTGLSYLDYSGAGVVHVTGGAAATAACYFYPNTIEAMKSKEPTSSSGVGILFTVIGFIGFNFASHLHISLSNHNYHSALVGMVAISTILSGSVAALITAIVHRFVDRKNTRNIYTSSFNGAVCGMIAAGASVNHPWFAFVIGITSSLIFIFLCFIITCISLDDTYDAIAVHLGGGLSGTLLSPLLSIHIKPDQELVVINDGDIVSYLGVLWNLMAVFIIFLWSLILSSLLFFILNRIHGFVISHKPPEDEPAVEMMEVPQIENLPLNMIYTRTASHQMNDTMTYAPIYQNLETALDEVDEEEELFGQTSTF